MNLNIKNWIGILTLVLAGSLQAQGQTPDYVSLMSPRCAWLHDAMRKAPVRGVNYEAVIGMRQEYSRDCSEQENRARQQLYERRSNKRYEAMATQEAERKTQQQTQQQARVATEMCVELQRIIKNKKMRTDLTPGELGDLERSEQNYKARCT